MALFEACDLHKRFGARVVLENVSLAFEEGLVCGIMGPNGAGKTTCFNVLTGLHAPDRGRLEFDGRDITGLPPQRIAPLGVARSFQMMNLFNEASALENVMVALPAFRVLRRNIFRAAFADPALREAAVAVLAEVGLAAKAAEPARSLSYGERRALEIGVALAARPRILFLDEPTSGLGTDAIRNLAGLVSRLRRTVTIVMIEHDMRFLFDLADRISVLHWGQVIAEGTPDDLRGNAWVRRSALGDPAHA